VSSHLHHIYLLTILTKTCCSTLYNLVIGDLHSVLVFQWDESVHHNLRLLMPFVATKMLLPWYPFSKSTKDLKHERSVAIAIYIAYYGPCTAFPYNNMTTSIKRVPLPVIWGTHWATIYICTSELDSNDTTRTMVNAPALDYIDVWHL